jgi:hypothetical protein
LALKSYLWAIALIAIVGCAGKTLVTPAWIRTLPQGQQGYVFAVGRSGPTDDPQKAEDQARRQARLELAKYFGERVRATEVLLSEDRSSERVSQATQLGATEEAVDQTVQKAELVEIWRDLDGSAGEKGAVFCLMRMRVP